MTEEIEKEVKDAAEISMGTEINETDEKYILSLSQQVIELSEYRESLNEYLKNRMSVIAPNLSMMVGELVGARLIAHAGSLVNLAKYNFFQNYKKKMLFFFEKIPCLNCINFRS